MVVEEPVLNEKITTIQEFVGCSVSTFEMYQSILNPVLYAL